MTYVQRQELQEALDRFYAERDAALQRHLNIMDAQEELCQIAQFDPAVHFSGRLGEA